MTNFVLWFFVMSQASSSRADSAGSKASSSGSNGDVRLVEIKSKVRVEREQRNGELISESPKQKVGLGVRRRAAKFAFLAIEIASVSLTPGIRAVDCSHGKYAFPFLLLTSPPALTYLSVAAGRGVSTFRARQG